VACYSWLYYNYSGMKGKKPLEEVKQSVYYLSFITKLRYLYEALGGVFGHTASSPWLLSMFTGMTETQTRSLTEAAIDRQLAQPVQAVTWTSPESLPGQAGVVSVTWKNGLRLVPEMQDLYQKLRDNGFDVWVCSGSFVEAVKEGASNPMFGYRNPDEHVLAMELERNSRGRIIADPRKGYDLTQGPGKTNAIRRVLVSRYGYGPVFIAGASESDQNMMNDFDSVKQVLIINRLSDPKSLIGRFSKTAVASHGKPDAKFLLQGRDDNKGIFVPSQRHYRLGSADGRALR
jgi:phosphoserine phosphatase